MMVIRQRKNGPGRYVQEARFKKARLPALFRALSDNLADVVAQNDFTKVLYDDGPAGQVMVANGSIYEESGEHGGDEGCRSLSIVASSRRARRNLRSDAAPARQVRRGQLQGRRHPARAGPVSYTHLRAHET